LGLRGRVDLRIAERYYTRKGAVLIGRKRRKRAQKMKGN